jgi:hypothetical protein
LLEKFQKFPRAIQLLPHSGRPCAFSAKSAAAGRYRFGVNLVLTSEKEKYLKKISTYMAIGINKCAIFILFFSEIKVEKM